MGRIPWATQRSGYTILPDLLLVPVLPQALLALVRGHLVPFPLFTARHVLLLLVVRSPIPSRNGPHHV